MTEQDKKTAECMLRWCDKLRRSVVKCQTYGGFLVNRDAVDASIFRVTVVSKLARERFSVDAKASMADVDWDTICSLYDLGEQDYDDLDLFRLWKVMTKEIPELSYALCQSIGRVFSTVD